MMLSVKDARDKLLASLELTSLESVDLEAAAGRVLAQAILSSVDLPPFSNSSMDGFALRSADIQQAGPENPVTLSVVGDIPAGTIVENPIEVGETMRIMTGAPLPKGADAVVPVEDTDFGIRDAGSLPPKQVAIRRRVDSGAYVRVSGEDLRQGETVLPARKPLRPQDIAMLASLGCSRVEIFNRPQIAIFSTGDELLPVEADLVPGKIRESNSYALSEQIRSAGGVPANLGIVPDAQQAVQDRLDQAVAMGADLIVTSAGVSVGAYDYVRLAIEAHGELNFWRVNMRPGKPLAFGSYREIPFVGLPGNPVSAFIGFEVFLRPAIMKMAGNQQWGRDERVGVLAEAIRSDGRESYLRGRLVGDEDPPQLGLTGHQGSGNLFSLVQAEVLILIPAGKYHLAAGDRVSYWPL